MMRILVIDDERPARSELIHLLQEIEPDAAITEADSGAAALELISRNSFDLVFIDINLGDINGTSLAMAAQQILPKAGIVFATAFSEYAIKAFEIGVSHYILKPVEKEKLENVVARTRQSLAAAEPAAQPAAAVAPEEPRLTKLPINSNRRVVMVEIGKIIFIETDNRGCIVHTQEGDFRENLPISEYERRLAGYRFFRIHKCFLVNLDQIHEILPWHNNSLALRMFGFEEKPLPVGRKNTRGLKHALNL